MDAKWHALVEAARAVRNPRQVSECIEAGGVAAAIESESGRIYTGVCVDTACSLGVCAERNAVFHMLTCGESEVRRVVAIGPDGRAISPCGACREFLAQLMPGRAREVEVLLDSETGRVASLAELTPLWWA